MKFLALDVRDDLQIPHELARVAVKFEAEQLAVANPDDLRLLFNCSGLSAQKIVAYARVKTGGIKVEPASAVSIASLQALYDTAIETWLRRGMITAGPLKVTFGEGIDLWVKAKRRYFIIAAHDFGQNHALAFYKVWGPTSFVNMLSTMGGRAWFLSIDGVLRRLISFAESYKTD